VFTSPAKTAELIEMLFGGLTRNHVLGGVKMPRGRGNFWGCSAHSKTLAVSAVILVAKGIIQSSITACGRRDHSICWASRSRLLHGRREKSAPVMRPFVTVL